MQIPRATEAVGTAMFSGEFDGAGIMANLNDAGTPQRVERELNELETDYRGLAAQLFGAPGASIQDRAGAVQLEVKDLMENFLHNPTVGAPGVMAVNDFFTDMLQPSLEARLVDQPIEWTGAYQPFYPLVLKKLASHDYKKSTSGEDELWYEDPISVPQAYNFSYQGGGGARVAEITGGKSQILPYFMQTPKYVLDFNEWSKRLIKLPVLMKKKGLQEIDMAIDRDVITGYDAVIPNSSRYDSHNSHIETITNVAGSIPAEVFRTASRYIRHTDSASGTVHSGVPGVALVDMLAYDELENWGTDIFTEEEVSRFSKTGFGTIYTPGQVVTGQKMYGYSLLRTPIEISAANRRVRFFPIPAQYGYYIPITLNGKEMFAHTGPMTGGEPDYGDQIQRTAEPPGMSFYIQISKGLAMQVVGYFFEGMINH